MAEKTRTLPHPERCICKHVIDETPRRPRLRIQPSLYEGVITEFVCLTCGAWMPMETVYEDNEVGSDV